MDEEHDMTLAAVAALDDLDAGRAAALYRPGDEADGPTMVTAHDECDRLRVALVEARRWHVIQRRVCDIGTRPATAMAHAERIAAIDVALGS